MVSGDTIYNEIEPWVAGQGQALINFLVYNINQARTLLKNDNNNRKEQRENTWCMNKLDIIEYYIWVVSKINEVACRFERRKRK